MVTLPVIESRPASAPLACLPSPASWSQFHNLKLEVATATHFRVLLERAWQPLYPGPCEVETRFKATNRSTAERHDVFKTDHTVGTTLRHGVRGPGWIKGSLPRAEGSM